VGNGLPGARRAPSGRESSPDSPDRALELARLRLRPTRRVVYPHLKGEGRTAEGSPGWGGGRAAKTPMPDLLHGRHPHPARWRGPTSPLRGEVIPVIPSLR